MYIKNNAEHMRVNINNTESIKVENREEAIDIIKEKMKVWMQEGDYLGWYKSDSNLDKPNIAAVYNNFHEETRYFARIVG